jgi:hypothetical protein
MPKIVNKTPQRKKLEQQLNECLIQLTKLGITKMNVVRRISFRNLGITPQRRLNEKQKFDRVNAALIKGHYMNELFAKRVIAATAEAIADHMEKVEGVKREETNFLLEPIDPLV